LQRFSSYFVLILKVEYFSYNTIETALLEAHGFALQLLNILLFSFVPADPLELISRHSGVTETKC
jgi:hypothetical protein